MAWPAKPALPPADKGKMSAALTWPVPSVDSGTGAAFPGVAESDGNAEKLELFEQPASSAAAEAARIATERRRVGMMAEPLTGNSADKAILLTHGYAPGY
jgi:hypothetical protein